MNLIAVHDIVHQSASPLEGQVQHVWPADAATRNIISSMHSVDHQPGCLINHHREAHSLFSIFVNDSNDAVSPRRVRCPTRTDLPEVPSGVGLGLSYAMRSQWNAVAAAAHLPRSSDSPDRSITGTHELSLRPP